MLHTDKTSHFPEETREIRKTLSSPYYTTSLFQYVGTLEMIEIEP
jgi:hypothetical protein